MTTQALEERTAALDAFVALSEAVGNETDVRVLAQQASGVLRATLGPVSAVYYEREEDVWKARVWSPDVSPAVLAQIQAGVPADAPSFAEAACSGTDVFLKSWNAGADHITSTRRYGAVAFLPLPVQGEVRSLFTVGTQGVREWTPREQAVVRAVGRSLGLALERAGSVALLARRTRELEHTNAELSRSSAELEQFAYVASHDLQAPIRAVTSFAGLIDKRYSPQLDDRGRLYLRQIVEGGEHMKRLVDDLLAFSRVHTQQGELLPVGVQAVFDAVARRLRGGALPAGASLTRGELPVVRADAQQLDRLFQNLISNGLKYHREGIPPRVHVSAQRDGEGWRFAAQDNGIGIEPQYSERIFVIFQRLHGREAYEGTGIGLAVCKKIVERHGGRLWVESTLGQGSTFQFTLRAG